MPSGLPLGLPRRGSSRELRRQLDGVRLATPPASTTITLAAASDGTPSSSPSSGSTNAARPRSRPSGGAVKHSPAVSQATLSGVKPTPPRQAVALAPTPLKVGNGTPAPAEVQQAANAVKIQSLYRGHRTRRRGSSSEHSAISTPSTHSGVAKAPNGKPSRGPSAASNSGKEAESGDNSSTLSANGSRTARSDSEKKATPRTGAKVKRVRFAS